MERPTLKAIQISDVHLDMDYRPGTKEDCGLAGCCRIGAGFPPPGEPSAGEWGSLFCDTPMKTFDNMLEFITETIKPDLVFWTGDNSTHNVWSNTADEDVIYTIVVTTMIQQAFKGSEITVLPILGNHDTWVVEFEDFEKINSNYEINHFKKYWNEWLDDAALEKFGEYGYYSMDIQLKNNKQVPDGSVVIALNTQACNPTNFYIWGERNDPGNMFHWLETELLNIEARGGLAIVIAHYTPVNCQHQFGTRYRALVERFQHIIRFGMAGHDHRKFYELTQSISNPGKPIMYTNVAPSVTPW